MEVQHIYIVGSKGCGNYGGYETFLEKLTEHHQHNKKIKYHIAWKGKKAKEFEYHGAHAFQMKVPNIGPAQAILYDIAALNYCLKHIKVQLSIYLHVVLDHLQLNFKKKFIN